MLYSYIDQEARDLSVGYVYSWRNLVTGRVYIGSHNGSKPKYIGSGVAFKDAIDRHGLDNFERVILYIGSRFREVEEEILIAVDAAENENFYNLTNYTDKFKLPKGHGPQLGKTGHLSHNYGRKASEETKAKLRSIPRPTGPDNWAWGLAREDHPNFGSKRSQDQRNNISVACRGLRSGEKNPNFGKKTSEETKTKIRLASHKRHHELKNIIKDTCIFCV